MKGPKTLANYGFQISIWGVMLVSAAIFFAGVADLSFNLKWGYSPKDVGMAVVVVAIASIVKIIGTKIIANFSDL